MIYAVESCVPWKEGGFRIVVRSTAYRYPRVGLVLPAEIPVGAKVTMAATPQGGLAFHQVPDHAKASQEEAEVSFPAWDPQEPRQGPGASPPTPQH